MTLATPPANSRPHACTLGALGLALLCAGCGSCAPDSPAQCAPDPDADLCAAASRSCGPLTTADRCGTPRTIDSCGSCDGLAACDADGRCVVCTAESDLELCSRADRHCGPFATDDRCGKLRALDCGSCPPPWSCNDAGFCDCQGESDADLCASASAECGPLMVRDACGRVRHLDCGSCPTGTCASNGQCRLVPPETDAEFCASQHRVCGLAQGTDKSGAPRLVASCGSCEVSLSCAPDGKCRVAGESCELPIRLNLGTATHQVTIEGNFWVTDSDAEGTCDRTPNLPDAVFQFELESRQQVTALLTAYHTSTVYPTLFLRSGCDLPFSEVACSKAKVSDLVRMTATLDPGTWFLWIDGLYPLDLGPVTLSLVATDPPPAPSNDGCAGALPLPLSGASDETRVSGSTFGAANDSNSPCGGSWGADVVYTFHLDAPGGATVILTPHDWTGVLYVQPGCSVGAANVIACTKGTNPRGAAAVMQLDLANLAPGDYAVWVDGDDPQANGDFDLTVKVRAPTEPPANDTCAGAKELSFSINGVATVDDVGADTSAARDDYAGSCGGAGAPDIVYSFYNAVPHSVVVTAMRDPTTPQFTPIVQLRSECADPLTEHRCEALMGSFYISNLPAGRYYLIVDGANATKGAFSLKVALGSPYVESGCYSPQLLTFDPVTRRAVAQDGNRGLWTSARGSCSAESGGGLVGYRFLTAVESEVTITARATAASRLVPEIVLSSRCGSIPDEAGCANAAPGSSTAVLRVPRLPAGLWYLLVGNADASEGGFELTVQLGTPPGAPAHDTCADAEPLGLVPASGAPAPLRVQRDATGARDDAAGSCGGAGGGDLFFSFELAAPSAVRVTVTPEQGGFAPVVYVREVCTSGAASDERGCGAVRDGPATLTTKLLGAGTHYLVVDDAARADGPFTLELVTASPIPDDCSSPSVLTLVPGVPLQIFGDTALAQDDEHSRRCQTASGKDLVYQFTTTQPLNLAARLTYTRASGTIRDAILSLKSVCAAGTGAQELACARELLVPGEVDLFAQRLAAGTWYLWVDSLGTLPENQGPFELQLAAAVPPPVPPNDRCEAPEDLVFVDGHAQVTGDLGGAGNDFNAAGCAAAGGPDAFYRFSVGSGSAQRLRAQVVATTPVPGFEPVLSVRSSCTTSGPGAGQEVACNSGGASTAVVTPALAAGTWYLVVDAVQAAGGPFELQAWLEPGSALPDGCGSAEEIDLSRSRQALRVYDLSSATNDTYGRCGGYSGRDVVVSFDTSGLGLQDVFATARASSRSAQPVLYLRAVCNASSSQDLACVTNAALIARSLPEGRYYLWLDAYNTVAGSTTLELQVSDSPGAPANDGCGGTPVPLDLTSGSASAVAELTWASLDETASCLPAAQDVVYSLRLDQAQNVTVSVAAEAAPPYAPAAFALKTACSAGDELVCVRLPYGAGGPPATATLRNLAAGTYYLWIAATTLGEESRYAVQVMREPATPSAAGDDCSSAVDLGRLAIGAVIEQAGSTAGANADVGLRCSTLGAKDLVYTFELGQAARVLFAVTPLASGFEPAVELRQDCAVLAPRWDQCVAQLSPGLAAGRSLDVAAGRWFLWVSSGDAAALPTEGPFQLRIQAEDASVAPTNDTCANALAITRGNPVVGTTVGANDDYSGPVSIACGHAAYIGPDVVYSYRPATSGTFEVVVTGMYGAPTVWVTEGNCGVSGACMAIAAAGRRAQYSTMVTGVAGRTYYLVVDDESATGSSTYLLEVR